MILGAILLCVIVLVTSNDKYMFDDDQNEVYPTYIPHYPVRVDKTTNKDVSRGRFELLGRSNFKLLNDSTKTFPVAKVKETLQCARHEPTISGNRGIVEILKMIPPTKKMTQHICMYIDTKCSGSKCMSILDKALEKGRCRDPTRWENLVRVTKGKLYIDWPFCISRPKDTFPFPSMTVLLFQVLDLVNDMPDSVFLVGAEKSTLKWNTPYPMISCSPDFHFSDIPWPWYESLNTEFTLYKRASDSRNFSEAHYRKHYVKQYLPWAQRTAKAAYFGEMIDIRQVFFDQALLRPDLIEARWKCEACNTGPWNPLSTERSINITDNMINPNILYSKEQSEGGYTVNPSTVGYLEPLNRLRITSSYAAPIGQFKYLVVLTGIGARAASGRLASYLAYSGAVILLQHSEFEYHFSARLKPWVHYVPLTYSAADIVNKIEWLKAHDDLAQQIANNGRNFGLSYLRLEDQFCYALTVLETLADLEKGSDVLEPFYPVEIPYIKN